MSRPGKRQDLFLAAGQSLAFVAALSDFVTWFSWS